MENTALNYIDAIMIFVAFIWGINAPIMKIGLFALPPMAYNALRMVVAIVLSWLILWLSHTYRPLQRQDCWLLFKISFWGFFFFQIFFTWGLNQTTSGNASLILGLLTVSVVLLNRIYNNEVITWPTAAGIAISLAGVVFVILGSGKEMSLEAGHVAGILLLLVAQFAYAYYTVFAKNLMQKYSAYQLMAYIMTISGFLFVLAALSELSGIIWAEVSPAGWGSVIFSGAFGLCIGNAIWVWGVKKLGSTKVALYNNLPPVFAVLTGCAFLNESFGLLQFCGAVIIFLGLYLTRTQGAFFRRLSMFKQNKNTKR